MLTIIVIAALLLWRQHKLGSSHRRAERFPGVINQLLMQGSPSTATGGQPSFTSRGNEKQRVTASSVA